MKTALVNGPKVKAARELAGLTQEDVAQKVGVHRATVASWESEGAKNKPGGPNFKRLCRVLKTAPEKLLVVPDDQAA